MMHLIERSNGLGVDIDAWNSTQSVKKTTRTDKKKSRERKKREEGNTQVSQSLFRDIEEHAQNCTSWYFFEDKGLKLFSKKTKQDYWTQ